MRIVSEAGVCAFTVVAETIAAAAAIPSADLIRWLMKLFFLMELKEFNQAKVRAASVNRTEIPYQRAVNATLLHRVRIADEKLQTFTIHCSIAASITTSCRVNACDRKMCIVSHIRKMRRV